jgi:hypothetical protein
VIATRGKIRTVDGKLVHLDVGKLVGDFSSFVPLEVDITEIEAVPRTHVAHFGTAAVESRELNRTARRTHRRRRARQGWGAGSSRRETDHRV